jgi:hypothetical protein
LYVTVHRCELTALLEQHGVTVARRRCRMSWKTLAGVGLLGFALGAMPVAGPGVGAEEQRPEEEIQAQSAEQVNPAAGFFSYAGGPVRAKRARTQTAATSLAESATWVSLAGGNLSYTVPSGTTDLFNIAFSTEGRLFRGGGDDYVRILHTINGVLQPPVEPYDGGQAFFSADGYATHKGNWVRRVGGGTHVLQVQFWIFDGAPAEVLSAWIDDWTFELVVYD